MSIMNTSLNKLSSKRIPTIIGLLILVAALILGTVFFQQGLGVFAPRATPETTPKQVRITNVVDGYFTVSFLTEGEVAGFVKYGTEPNALRQTATDDRDTLTGSIGEYTTHHITVRGLQPNTTYYYVLGTGNNTLFDNNGEPFKIVTARKSGSPTAARTVHGSVTSESGSPAEGAIVYVGVEGAGEMSSLVKNSGAWAVPLSNARTPDGAAYAEITDDTSLQLFVQGLSSNQTARVSVTAGQYKSEAIPTISYGQTAIEAPAASTSEDNIVAAAADETTNTDEGTEAETDTEATAVPLTSSSETDTASNSAELDTAEAASDSGTVVVLDLSTKSSTPKVVHTSQPIITGKAVPNVTITIEVNSESQIVQQIVSDENGNFRLNIEELSQSLEAGQHTVRYSYTDPSTGEVVQASESFFVEPQSATANLLAQASTTPAPTATPSATPFGSSNPFPITGSTTSASPTTATSSSTGSSATRSSQPSTSSGMPVSGSIGTTMALIFGGLFFIISGLWSFWVSRQYAVEEVE